MADHWHVTAETVTQTPKLSIAAVMAVYDDQQPLEVELQEQDGWLGATARGDFGHVKGWIRYHDTHTPPGDVPAGTGDTPSPSGAKAATEKPFSDRRGWHASDPLLPTR